MVTFLVKSMQHKRLKMVETIYQKMLKMILQHNTRYPRIVHSATYYKDNSVKFDRDILNITQKFNSSSSTIIRHPSKELFVTNTRIVNYMLNEIGVSSINSNTITLNKLSILDNDFNELSNS